MGGGKRDEATFRFPDKRSTPGIGWKSRKIDFIDLAIVWWSAKCNIIFLPFTRCLSFALLTFPRFLERGKKSIKTSINQAKANFSQSRKFLDARHTSEKVEENVTRGDVMWYGFDVMCIGNENVWGMKGKFDSRGKRREENDDSRYIERISKSVESFFLVWQVFPSQKLGHSSILGYSPLAEKMYSGLFLSLSLSVGLFLASVYICQGKY